jgi:hypothetical protein
MNLLLKAAALELTLDHPYALNNTPALSIKLEKYELKGDLRSLIRGLQDMAEMFEPKDIDFDGPDTIQANEQFAENARHADIKGMND